MAEQFCPLAAYPWHENPCDDRYNPWCCDRSKRPGPAERKGLLLAIQRRQIEQKVKALRG